MSRKDAEKRREEQSIMFGVYALKRRGVCAHDDFCEVFLVAWEVECRAFEFFGAILVR